jgi:hypothetical protein
LDVSPTISEIGDDQRSVSRGLAECAARRETVAPVGQPVRRLRAAAIRNSRSKISV